MDMVKAGKEEEVFLQLQKKVDEKGVPFHLQKRVDPNCVDERGYTPTHICGYTGRVKILQMLLDANADPDIVENHSGSTAAHKAASYGYSAVLHTLLLNKAQIDIKNKKPHRNTPLHDAAREGWVDCVRILLEFNAEAEIKNDFGMTPVDMATMCNQGVCAQLIQEHLRLKNLANKTKDMVEPLEAAKRGGACSGDGCVIA